MIHIDLNIKDLIIEGVDLMISKQINICLKFEACGVLQILAYRPTDKVTYNLRI